MPKNTLSNMKHKNGIEVWQHNIVSGPVSQSQPPTNGLTFY